MDGYFSRSIISYLHTDGPSQFDELSITCQLINSSLMVLYKKIMFQIGLGRPMPRKEFNIIHFETLTSLLL